MPASTTRSSTALEEQVGVVNGLAWTSVGGELLEVEVNVVPGSGKVELTGNLGDVMKESAQAALTYIRSRAAAAGDRHATSTRKRTSTSTSRRARCPRTAPPPASPSPRPWSPPSPASPSGGDVAMTGEVTLRGRVLPIGGLREKTMAALRNGIHTVLIPAGQRGRPGRDRPDRPQCPALYPGLSCGPGAGRTPWSIRLWPRPRRGRT